MSEVKRYFTDCNKLRAGDKPCDECDVKVVLATDYAALEAECASLKNSLLAITTRHFVAGMTQRSSEKELDHLADGIAQLEVERDAALAECGRLRGLLREAAEEIADWGAYASDYFQEKHDLEGCVAKFHDAALSAKT